MTWRQVSTFRYAEDGIGWCLRQTQSTFSAPVAFPDARTAWDGQKGRHTDYPPLGIAVPIWFDHWGNYGNPSIYKNWGHVATRLPDGRVLTSPFWPKTYGYDIFPNIQAMMRALGGNAKYLGWSEYMNGKQIVSYTNTPTPPPPPTPGQKEGEDMQLWIADVKGAWYLVVPTGAGKPNAVGLPGDSGMGGGGAAKAGIPVIKLKDLAALKLVANA